MTDRDDAAGDDVGDGESDRRDVRDAAGDSERAAGAADPATPDRERRDPAPGATPDRDPRDHEFSEGEGFSEPYEGFDLDPPELAVDPDEVDPVDSRALADLLDERQVPGDEVDADELVEVGLNYMGINRHEQAAEAFERAARFADDPSVEQEAWVNKGVTHAELEEYDRAVGAYREALFVDDEGEHAATAETNMAYALWERGKDEEAFEHAERAVTVDRRLPQAWYNLGFIEAERGLYEDALECFENAQRLGMRTAELHEERARALEELGRTEEAEAAQEAADEIRERMEEELVG
ncbi:MAG: tetratricopeptide repeat protein [Halobacteriaceae archaeon]